MTIVAELPEIDLPLPSHRCRFFSKDGSGAQCIRVAEFTVKYFMTTDDKVRRNHACKKHLGKIVEGKAHGGAIKIIVYPYDEPLPAEALF